MSESHTNIAEHFPKNSEDFQRLPETFEEDRLACIARVPVPRERNWGRAKEFIRIRAARKMR